MHKYYFFSKQMFAQLPILYLRNIQVFDILGHNKNWNIWYILDEQIPSFFKTLHICIIFPFSADVLYCIVMHHPHIYTNWLFLSKLGVWMIIWVSTVQYNMEENTWHVRAYRAHFLVPNIHLSAFIIMHLYIDVYAWIQ